MNLTTLENLPRTLTQIERHMKDRLLDENVGESSRSRLKEYLCLSGGTKLLKTTSHKFDRQLGFLAEYIKKDLLKGGKLYDEELRRDVSEGIGKDKQSAGELKTKYSKEFIARNMKKTFEGVTVVNFKGKSKWGEGGYSDGEEQASSESKPKPSLGKLSKKKQKELQAKSKKLLQGGKKKKKKGKGKEFVFAEKEGDVVDILEVKGGGGGWGDEGFQETRERANSKATKQSDLLDLAGEGNEQNEETAEGNEEQATTKKERKKKKKKRRKEKKNKKEKTGYNTV